MSKLDLHIVIDSRERQPFTFDSASVYEGTTVEAGTLVTGDYSIRGLESIVACERKSLPDLVGCLAGDRERFERELQRSRALEAFAVIVEAPWEALAKGQYRSRLQPFAATQSIAAFSARMRVPFWFCGSRPAAEFCCWSFLKQYAQGRLQELKAIERAMGLRMPRTVRGRQSADAADNEASSFPA